MGSPSPQAVRDEIGAIRADLDAKLTELERRLPPIVAAGKKIAIALAGGTGGTLLLLVLRKARGFSRARRERRPAAAPGVSVQVLPPGTIPAAIGVAAIWAGVRLYEARLRSAHGEQTGRGSLRSVRDALHAS